MDTTERLIEDLVHYAAHKGTCAVPPWEIHNAPDCTCGLRATLQSVKEFNSKTK